MQAEVSHNETGDWIFSDEAHRWMDLRRMNRGNYQRSHMAHSSSGEGRPGWEHGLFGFKDNMSHSLHVYRATDENPEAHFEPAIFAGEFIRDVDIFAGEFIRDVEE